MAEIAEQTSLGARVTARILELIAAGELEAGQRLIEPELAQRLGVGTVPVREALRTLAGDGVVAIVPHKGATLRPMNAKEILDTLKGIVALLKVALDELEPVGCAAIIPELEAIRDRILADQAAGDGLAVLHAFADYQLCLIRASGNAYVERTVRKVHFHYYLNQVQRFLAPAKMRRISASHIAITRDLAEGRFDRARRAFDRNVRMVGEMILPEAENNV